VVIQVVEAFDEEVVGFVDVFIQTDAVVEKMAGESAFFCNLLLGKEIGRFPAVLCRCCSGRWFRICQVRVCQVSGRRFSGLGFSAHQERLADGLQSRMLALPPTLTCSRCDACPSISAPKGLYS